MKYFITLFILFIGGLSYGQYSVDYTKAPLNTVPIKYTLAHYNLNGPVVIYDNDISTYTFNKDGFLIQEKASLGGVYQYVYDSNNRLTNLQIDLFGVLLNYKIYYDSQGRIIKKATENTNVGEVYKYDSNGRFIERLDAKGNDLKNRYAYDSSGRVTLEETFYSAINRSSTKTVEYKPLKGSLMVNTVYVSSSDNKEIASTLYYANGNYCGKDKVYRMNQIDKYGNYLAYLNGNGTITGKKMYKYLNGSASSNYSEKEEDIASPSSPNNTTVVAKADGCSSGDCLNGWGKKDYEADYYEGFWKNGKKEGYGMYIWDGFGKYIGSWKSDIMDGYGVYIAENKDNIIGEYSNGQLNGWGIEVQGETWTQGLFNNGTLQTKYDFFTNKVETGCTAGDCQDTYGRMKWSNGDQYTGYFKNGTLYMGTYVFASGDKYSGMFNTQGQFHGMGRFFFKDGAYYGGNWSNGKYDGLGYYHNKDLEQQIGEWSMGNLVKSYR